MWSGKGLVAVFSCFYFGDLEDKHIHPIIDTVPDRAGLP